MSHTLCHSLSRRWIAGWVVLLTGALACAPPAGAQTGGQTGEYRVVGLFSPDREQDLRDVLAGLPELQLVGFDYENARASFRYDLQALFPNLNPKKPPTAVEVEQRLNALLNTASAGTFSLKPLPAAPEVKLKQLEIPVGLLDCKGCRYAAYLAVTKVGGVERATVGPDRVVRAWIDPTKVDRAALEAALKKANFDPAPKP